jgi:hypothetical protein
MQGALFSVFNKEIGLSLTQTLNQAEFAKKAGIDEANQTLVGGIGSLAGAVVSFGILAQSNSEAKACDDEIKNIKNSVKGETLSMDVKQVNDKEIPMQEISKNDAFSIKGRDSSTGIKELSEDDKEKIQKLKQDSEMLRIHGNAKQQMASHTAQGLANAVQYKYIKQKGEDQAAQYLAQGLGNVLNTETSQMASAISSCDNNMQSTNGVISTIIQVSAVRG